MTNLTVSFRYPFSYISYLILCFFPKGSIVNTQRYDFHFCLIASIFAKIPKLIWSISDCVIKFFTLAITTAQCPSHGVANNAMSLIKMRNG